MAMNNEVWIHIDCAFRKDVDNTEILNFDAFLALVRLEEKEKHKHRRKDEMYQ